MLNIFINIKLFLLTQKQSCKNRISSYRGQHIVGIFSYTIGQFDYNVKFSTRKTHLTFV